MRHDVIDVSGECRDALTFALHAEGMLCKVGLPHLAPLPTIMDACVPLWLAGYTVASRHGLTAPSHAVAERGTRHPYSCWISTVNELSTVRAGDSLVTMVFVTV
jgi:hypothetical protein